MVKSLNFQTNLIKFNNLILKKKYISYFFSNFNKYISKKNQYDEIYFRKILTEQQHPILNITLSPSLHALKAQWGGELSSIPGL